LEFKTVANKVIKSTITLEKIIDDNNLEVVDFLKVDIEGAEIYLADSKNLNILKDRVKHISIETHSHDINKDLVKILSDNNFEILSNSNNHIQAYNILFEDKKEECQLKVMYNDDLWSTIVSPDQQSINKYLERIKDLFIGKKALHIGIGTSTIFTKFNDIFSRIDGITVMDSEIDVAKQYIIPHQRGKSEYVVHKFNKYNIKNFDFLDSEYSVIIDNNLKHYACCNHHWEKFYKCIIGKLEMGGVLLTHTQGFAPHTNNVTSLSIKELEKLSSKDYSITVMENFVNSEGYFPVVVKRKNKLIDGKNLMVVAHPDDEIIFGYTQLMNKLADWTVLCITNGDNKDRSREFKNIMEKISVKYEIWDYLDLWDDEFFWDIEQLSVRIKKFLELGFDNILTHNKDGDYGHPQHKILSKLMSEIVTDENLFYFDISNIPLDGKVLKNKLDIFSLYKTQFKRDSLLPLKNFIKEGYRLQKTGIHTEKKIPTLNNPVAQCCTQNQMESNRFYYWMKLLDSEPTYWRKLWEEAYIAEVLWQQGMLVPGKRGIGFGCGSEKLVSLFANFGCKILATDFQSDNVVGSSWRNEHGSNLDSLFYPEICSSRELYNKNVEFREVDMGNIPKDLGEFDFMWSSCAFEHIAPKPIILGPKFVQKSFRYLKPGGIAVHTTEYNVSSNEDTIEDYFERGDGSVEGAVAIYRKKDLLTLFNSFEDIGAEPIKANWNTGDGPIDNEIDGPPGEYKRVHHIKALVGHNTDPNYQYITTSIGFYLKKRIVLFNKKKLLIISPHLSTGGSCQYLLKYIETFGKDYSEITVVEFTNFSPEFDIQKNKILDFVGSENLVTLGDYGEWDTKGEKYFINKRLKLLNIIEEFNPDIVWMNEFPECYEYKLPPDKVMKQLYDSDRSYKIIETTHNNAFDFSDKKYIPDEFLFCDSIHLKKSNNIDISKTVWEYPIELKERPNRERTLKKLELDPDYLHILNVGLLNENKNQKYIFNLADKFRNDKIMFHFIGNHCYIDDCGITEDQLNNPNCKVWGERSDVDEFYSCMDLFLFPSKRELNPITIREALSWNMTIIANKDEYTDKYNDYSNFYLLDDINIEDFLRNMLYNKVENVENELFYNIEEQRYWNGDVWERSEEKWSGKFGGTDKLWDTYIFNDIKPFLSGDVLEIGVGQGRMTEKLLQYDINFIGVDLNESCIEYCKNKFSDNKNVLFYTNDGLSLSMIEDNSINFIFSWDSFVHMHKNVVESYLVELNRVLKIRGHAFIHHANFWDGSEHSFKNLAGRANLRPEEMVEMCKKNNLEILSQKPIDWSNENFEIFDYITIIKKV